MRALAFLAERDRAPIFDHRRLGELRRHALDARVEVAAVFRRADQVLVDRAAAIFKLSFIDFPFIDFFSFHVCTLFLYATPLLRKVTVEGGGGGKLSKTYDLHESRRQCRPINNKQ